MRIDNDVKLDFKDVLIRPKRSDMKSRNDVQLERTFGFLHSKHKWTGIPVVAANMDSSGSFEMAEKLSKYKMITALSKYYSLDELKNFFKKFNKPDYVAFSMGIRNGDIEKLDGIIKAKLQNKFRFVCMDVPNGYLEEFVNYVGEVRKKLPNHIIIAGNVVTNEMTEQLLLNGADIVKVGIGSGSACTTRLKTGVGYPQLSAVIECADAAHGISSHHNTCGLIMSDGGAVHPSCVAKAFAGGADFLMSGSLFSGYEESGGETVIKEGVKYKEYYGSSSEKAQTKNYGSVKSYRASEGRSLLIPHKGGVEKFVLDLLGSLRSTATYIGARRLKEFSRRATFIKVNRQLNDSLEKFEA